MFAAALVVPAQALPPLVVDGAIGPGWRVVGLPQQKPPLTRYTAVVESGQAAVRLEADASYGNLVAEPSGTPVPAGIAWQWRIERGNSGTALARKSGDDTPARVCLGFDLPLERVPFFERQKLRLARALTGAELPAATLCWAWGGAEPVGRVVVNPYTPRVRTLVLRNERDALAQWHDERRDVHADFRLAFGDEWTDTVPPPLRAAFVAADADNTGARTLAHVAELRFVAPPEPRR